MLLPSTQHHSFFRKFPPYSLDRNGHKYEYENEDEDKNYDDNNDGNDDVDRVNELEDDKTATTTEIYGAPNQSILPMYVCDPVYF